MRWRGWLAGLAAVLPVSQAWPASTEAVDWLVRMSEAARTATYQGIVVYSSGNDRLETFRVSHEEQDGVERERIQSLNGSARDILKVGNQIIALLPRDRKVKVTQPPTPKGIFPQMTAERVQRMNEIYDLSVLGEARVAGRTCRGVAVKPFDQYRYGYEMWADTKTAVPLKVNLTGKDGTTLEHMMFTEVEFPADIPNTAFDMPPEDAERALVTLNRPAAPPPMPVEPAASQNLILDQLPPGFRIIKRDIRELPNQQGSVEHLVISDGISAISVFSTHRNADAPPRPMSQIGATHIYGRVVGGTRVTVVGEVPETTVRMIGDSLKPAEKPSVDPAKPAEAPAAESQ